MAIYRPIQVSFWQDPYILELTKDQRYFYLYLLTNSRTTQCGIYQVSFKVINFETDLDEDVIKGLIRGLEHDKKIMFNEQNNEIMLLNWLKYNPVNNKNIEKRIIKELEEVKTKSFVDIYIKKVSNQSYNATIIKGAYKGLVGGYEEININSNINTNINSNINTNINSNMAEPTTPTPFEIITASIVENINPMITPFEMELVDTWTKEHSTEIILAAIKETALNKVANLKYTDAILRTWKQKNIKSLADLENNKKKKVHASKEPDWLEQHEQYRESKKDLVEDVDHNQLQNLINSFKKEE